MDISREEAQASLSQVQDVVERTKKMIAYGGGDVLFVIWGVIWVMGYLGTHFLSSAGMPWARMIHWLWIVLVLSGIIISVIVGRRNMSVKSPVGKRLGLFWFLLYAYVNIGIVLMSPFIKVQGAEESAMFWVRYGAIAAIVPMFAYVVMGLWLDNFMVWIGLGVTALTVFGVYLLQPYFYVWMAVTGGGTLIGTGFFIRKRWR